MTGDREGSSAGDESDPRPRRQRQPPPTSPYSSGGGGVVLEHDADAYLLAHLLLPDPLPLLGEPFRATELTLQASRLSEVDDVVVSGTSPNGDVRRVAIAIRRDPTIGPSDEKFAKLWVHIVATTRTHAGAIEADLFRTALMVAGPHTPARELGDLCSVARAQTSSAMFREVVAAGPAVGRQRLALVDQLTKDAVLGLGTAELEVNVEELTWQVLKGHFVQEVYLEGDPATDRATIVGRLTSVSATADGPGLWGALVQRAREYDPSGATVDEAKLRRDLVGVAGVLRSPRLANAWRAVDELDRVARSQVTGTLTHEGRSLGLPRDELREAVAEAASQGTLLLTGQPDTGKSALAIAVGDQLRAAGGAVVILNLRDLPPQAGGLSSALGASASQVFGGMAVGTSRTLIIDGAEAVQQFHGSTFGLLTSAAIMAGVHVLAVARADAAGAVTDSLVAALPSPGLQPARIEVPALSDPETTAIVTAFPILARLAAPQSRELIARPGLTDLLLRAEVLRFLPDGVLGEADVLRAVWAGLIRNAEVLAPNGATPDDREAVALDIARAVLTGTAAQARDGLAVASLRSDAVARRRGTLAPWGADDFASDLLRDLAIAALVARDGFGLITSAGSPRWAIRATRLAIQVRLTASPDIAATWTAIDHDVVSVFGTEGGRWRELLLEAALDPRLSGLLSEVWLAMIADDGVAIRELLRIAEQRYGHLDAIRVDVADPLAEVLVEHLDDLRQIPSLEEATERFALMWLAGHARLGSADQPSAPRQHVRTELLAARLFSDDEEKRLQAIATLGADLDAAAREELRLAAREAPHELIDAVEDIYARVSLAVHDPALLLELSEAYYLEPDDDDPDERWHAIHDDGIRDHRFHGPQLAAPYYGPFRELLSVRPLETINLINRLLDHAARHRVRTLASLDAHTGGRAEPQGAPLSVGHEPGRSFVGDDHVWGWYRGNRVGAYPAMSALMAVEDWCDQQLALGAKLADIVALLLEGAHNLAMPGLVYGLLIRYVERVTDELDGFLVSAELWRLEPSRLANEAVRLNRPDDKNRFRAEWRTMLPAQAAGLLVLRARSAGDKGRLDALADIGNALAGLAATAASEEEAALWRQRAALFDPASYSVVTDDDGRVFVQAMPPPDTVETLLSQNDGLARVQQGYGLLEFGWSDAHRDLDRLLGAVSVARQHLAEPPPTAGDPLAPSGAVAMALLEAHAGGSAGIPVADLIWGIRLLAELADRGPTSEHSRSRFAIGADRLAARGLTVTVLPGFHELAHADLRTAADQPAIRASLAELLASAVDEVRRYGSQGLARAFDAPCGAVFGGECRHVVAFKLGTEPARLGQLGSWGDSGTRTRVPLVGDLVAALEALDPRDTDLDHLAGPLVIAQAAAASTACVVDEAREVRVAILDVYRRAVPLYLEHHYSLEDSDRETFAVALLATAQEEAGPLRRWLEELGSNAEAVEALLEDAARAATYDASARAILAAAWPIVADVVLEALSTAHLRHEKEYLGHDAAAAVIPAPQFRFDDQDPIASIAAAADGWVRDADVRQRIERWLGHAEACGDCLDSLVNYLRTRPLEEQRSDGLSWVRRIVDAHGAAIARRSYLVVAWLTDVRASGPFDGSARRDFEAIIDELAAAGHRRAAELQAAEE
jgi:hypothetical protein